MTIHPPVPAVASRLPVWRLLALTLAGFIAIVTETLPAGLLPQISTGLAIDPAMAGQLISVYALGSVVAAIPLIAATRSWRRRPLLLLAIGGLLLCNSLTALSTDYGLTLVVRFAAGMAAGLIWGLLAGYARRLVVPALQGRGPGVVGGGPPPGPWPGVSPGAPAG
uniref:MFS transporter n=1 Tax=Pseudomonas sp. KCJK8993 TaxID=3344565 RepID=UPI0039060E76